MENTKNKIFPYIIALTALSVSASAAFYSVTGLSKLFAGASIQVMIMAGSLEIAKLVIASLLYQYWNELNKTLRAYLCIATIVLMLITSMGIYGYLSAAYQDTATKSLNAEAQVTLLETKKQNFIQQRDLYNKEKDNLIQGIIQLQSGLSNNKISYVDKKGNLIQTTSSSNRKSFEKQLDNSTARQSEISAKLDVINDSIFKLDTQIIETKTNNNTAGELGPLKYLSNITGSSMDSIINWLLLVIIFVFDPLAISLVIASNFAFDKAFPKKRENLHGELIDDFSEWDDLDDEGEPKYTKEEVDKMNETRDKILEKSTLYKAVDKVMDPKTKAKYENLDIIDADDLKNTEVKEPEEVSILQNFNNFNAELDNITLTEDDLAPQQEFDILDLNKDGIVDDEERAIAESKIATIENELNNNNSLSGWRANKMRQEAEELRKKINPDNIIDYN